jgi:nucleotide-binding universal stress UspA family protein
MLPFRKILFPVDYSDPCRAVVPYITDLLRHYSAELTLVHSYAPAAALADNDIALIDPKLPERVQADQDRRLRAFAQREFPGMRVDSIAELGEPGCVIHKIAQQQEADLVMLATHGYGPVRRFLLGSVTAKVLHDVSAAVWTGIGSSLTEHAAKIPYESIVCAVNDSEEAEAVVRAAAAVAAVYAARLSLLHVVEPLAVSPEVDFGPLKKELISQAEGRLRRLAAIAGVDTSHTVLDSTVADGIRDEVLQRKADLVVTGRGLAQATFARMWSHLFAIVRESPCPVLSI